MHARRVLDLSRLGLVAAVALLVPPAAKAQDVFPNIGEPVPGLILNTQLVVGEGGSAGVINTGGLQSGVEGFVDRDGQQWLGIPSQLTGADYIQTAQENSDVHPLAIDVTVAEGTILHLIIPENDHLLPFDWMAAAVFGAMWVNTGAVIMTSWSVPAQVWSTSPLRAGTYRFGELPFDDLTQSFRSFYGIAATLHRPTQLTANLVTQVTDVNLAHGLGTSVDSKLQTALRALDDLRNDNDIAAANTLQAFINAVRAQRGKAIGTQDADALIAAAEDIIEAIDAAFMIYR